ncbi:MAG TPA: AAA family ATPase [Thermoanaerobaculia bacterium]
MHLLEREDPLARLSELVAVAASGSGSVAAVLGEAGVGKTSLLRSLAAREGENVRVVSAGCEALFTPRPLGPFYDASATLDVDMEMPRERLFPAVLAACVRVPTLLVIEDVHWADRATFDLLKYLARRVAATPLLLVLSYRDDEVGPEHPLVSVLGESNSRVERIALEPLSRRAVDELAAERGVQASPELYALTGGNPFYVTEVLAGRSSEVPPTVRDAVLARLATQPSKVRTLIEYASLFPSRIELTLLDAEDEEIEAATHSGIVRVEEKTLVFRHELGRRAIEASLSDIRRIPAHRKILDLLLACGERSMARLAHHASGARDAGMIVRFSTLAAEEAAKASAHRESAAHYRTALAWAGAVDDADRALLLEALAYECYLTEQLDEALEHTSTALAIRRALGDLLREGDNLRWQSRIFWFLGRNTESREKAVEAIAVLEELAPASPLAMAWSNKAQLHMLAGECTEAIHWGSKAIELATVLGDDETLAHALNNVGSAEALLGLGNGKLQESLEISLAGGYQEHAARAYTNLECELVRAGDYEAARRYLDEGIAWCRARDLDSWTLYMSGWEARLNLETGNWEKAERAARYVISHRGGSAISRLPALAVLGRLLARRGDPAAATLLDEGMELAQRTGEFQRIAPVAAARAEAVWLRRLQASGEVDGSSAADVADEAHEGFGMPASYREPSARGDLALWMWRGGALETAPPGITEPYALQINGRWREAAAAFESAGRPYEAAAALLDGDEAEATHRALTILENLGAEVLCEYARRKLRRLRARGPRTSTREQPAGLTRREVEILELLDEGLRNTDIAERLFVSPKTVDHHVSSILSKLGARTRGEAARLFRSQK